MSKKTRRPLVLWILGAGVLLLCVCPLSLAVISGIGEGLGILPSDTPRPSATRTAEPTLTMTRGPSATPMPTSPPTETVPPTATRPPTATLTADQVILVAVEDALGSSNRDVDRVREVSLGYLDDPGIIFVSFAINDNLTEGMVRLGARLDVRDVVRTIAESGIDYTELWVFGTFSMVDIYGNMEETEVVRMFYDRETVDRIDWEGFVTDNIYIVADDGWLHPAFRE